MNLNVFYGILIPFIGTSAGAACVFFMKKDLNQWVQRCLTGFAAGVMVAASVWSLLIPALEQSEGMGKLLASGQGCYSCFCWIILFHTCINKQIRRKDRRVVCKKRLCLYWQLHFIISRKEWQSVSFMLVI